MGLKVLRELLNSLFLNVAAWPGMLAPGATVALDGCGLLGCQGWTSLSQVVGTLSPSDCPNLGRGLQV